MSDRGFGSTFRANRAGSTLAAAGLPAVLAAWLIHPALTLRDLANRRRRRVDRSLRFWQLGMTAALSCLPLAVLSWFHGAPSWSLALGWCAIWGWALTIVHGMLYRIVPFLVWFHRFSSRVGLEDVPTMRSLLPDSRASAALWAHSAALALGLSAALSGSDLLARLTGVAVVLTALLWWVNLVLVVARRE